MKEERDLYNDEKEVTGEKYYKGDKIPENMYTMVVTLFIQNDKNEFLLQKRSEQKGGKYAFTSGHPKSGETSTQGIIRESKEEMGLDIEAKEIELIHTEKTKNAFFDFYYLKREINLSKLIVQKKEVENVKWFSMYDIEEMIKRGELFENHIEAWYIINNFLKKKM